MRATIIFLYLASMLLQETTYCLCAPHDTTFLPRYTQKAYGRLMIIKVWTLISISKKMIDEQVDG